MPEEHPDMKIIEAHLGKLIEHFDTVQILATRHDPAESNGTLSFYQGEGNWFARYGQCKEWVIKQEQHMLNQVRKDSDA